MPDLTGFPAINVAIGLAFLFFLLSTASSAINEAIASLLGWRAKTLERAVSNLLGDADLTKALNRKLLRTRLDLTKLEHELEKKVEVPGAGVLPEHLTANVLEHWAVKALVDEPGSKI